MIKKILAINLLLLSALVGCTYAISYYGMLSGAYHNRTLIQPLSVSTQYGRANFTLFKKVNNNATPMNSYTDVGFGFSYRYQIYPSKIMGRKTKLRSQTITLPIWFIMLILVVYPIWFFWSNWKKSLPGNCKKCNYNLTGNESGTCPECGTKIKP